eukprot:879027-Pelagomonas_calceolata.AAC.4
MMESCLNGASTGSSWDSSLLWNRWPTKLFGGFHCTMRASCSAWSSCEWCKLSVHRCSASQICVPASVL